MRLINTATLEFEETVGEEHPPYAILSHRWGKQEVSFQEYMERSWRHGDKFSKIYTFCEVAASYGYEWVWVDTCCIDKKSSAELSGSINSMWRYYSEAAMCFAFLQDVTARRLAGCNSEWFSRGWTLQELLAPRQVQFFNQDWDCIGWKTEDCEMLAAITGIPANCLKEPWNLQSMSIAQKMSWASRRVTTRSEDIAYCLMGLFDVNMPLIYGEGSKDFLRLQLEIIRKTNDESIFAWEDNLDHWGMLARSPVAFRESGNVLFGNNVSYELSWDTNMEARPYSMTNAGLELKGMLVPEDVYVVTPFFGQTTQTRALVLRCWKKSLDVRAPKFIQILVEREGSRWKCVMCDHFYSGTEGVELLKAYSGPFVQTIFVRQPDL